MGTNYSGLQTMVSGLLNRRDATTSQVQGWIQLGLQRIQRELRVPAMEEIANITIQDYTLWDGSLYTPFPGIAIPSDFIELIDLLSPGGHRLQKEDITRVDEIAKALGPPRWYYRKGGAWLIAPAPIPGTVMTIVYYGEFDPLINGTDTNIISNIAPDLIVYSALGYAADFYSDKRGDSWEKRYQATLIAIQNQADEDETNGGSTVSPAYSWPPEYTYEPYA